MPSIKAMLGMVPGFEELEGPVLEQMASVGEIVEAPQGEILFCKGTMPEALHVLLEGRVCLTGPAVNDSASAVIDIVGPNASLVLANVLAGDPYQMSAEVVANATIISIPAVSVRAAITAQPAIALAMIRAMSAEFGAMTRQVADLKVCIVVQRLASYLLNLVSDPTANQAEFKLPVNKGLLASWLGCRAENLSRAFVGLRAYGVETHGSRVKLHDVPQLRVYAGAVLSDSDVVSQGVTAGRLPIERILGDAFRLRTNRPRES